MDRSKNDLETGDTVAVPKDAAGKTFHLICEVADDGTHNLSSYRRVIFKVTGEPVLNMPLQKNASHD
ncbi:MAG: hypothetical protein AB8B55_24410 [Mariniblastus sp.]